MKIIFADVDGVLNDEDTIRRNTIPPLCPDAVGRLIGLLDRTGALLVFSSTWRLSKDSLVHLDACGLVARCHVDCATPDLSRRSSSGLIIGAMRGDEVDAWLAAHPDVREWAIVDDEDGFHPHHRSRLVRTDFETGLVPDAVEKLERILGLRSPEAGRSLTRG